MSADRNTKITTNQIADSTLLPTDLDATNALVDNYVPSYDQATGKFTWIAVAGGVSNLPDLGDVDFDTGTPADNNVLTYDSASGKWKAEAPTGGASQLSDLSDVGVTTPTNKNILIADGDSWESRALVEADISDLGSYLLNLVEDTTPQLGGDLDLNGFNIDFPSVANISDVKDEDDMASNSATMLATQQSIKAYVDNAVPDLSTSVDDFTIKYESNKLKVADRIEYNIMLLAFYRAVDNSKSIFNLLDGFSDEYEDETGIDTGASTNENYDSTNDLYSPTSPSPPSNIEQLNQNTDTPLGMSGGVKHRIAQSFILGSTVVIDKISLEFNANFGVPVGDVTVTIETDVAGEPSGILAHANATKTITVTPSAWNDFDFTNFTLPAGTYWIRTYCDNQANGNYWKPARADVGGYGGGFLGVYRDDVFAAEGIADTTFKVIFAPGETSNMTLISNSQTAETAPADARIVIFEEDVDAVTVNTDIKAYISRDGGTTWIQVTLSDEGNYEGSKRVLAGVVDISGQPSGTNIEYKITTHNAKDLKIHGTGVNWD